MSAPAARPGGAARAALHTVFVLSLLWSAGFLAWLTLAAADFGYPLLYDALAIDRHIERYGPQNYYKPGFAQTGREERLALFAAINAAVHHGGRGLEAISYRGPGGTAIRLLREPERVHLASVARLLDRLELLSYLMLAALIASVAGLRRARLPLPAPRRVLLVTLGTIVAATVLVLAVGAERVFNTLHTWVFPAGEQWYFFYEESLMTTLMKAPDLFGAIAVLLVLVGLGYFALLLAGIRSLLRRRLTPGRG